MMPNKIFKKSSSIAEKGPIAVEGASINSPLQRFVRAKKRISQTFDEIYLYLKESRTFIIDCEIAEEYENQTRKELKQVRRFLKYL